MNDLLTHAGISDARQRLASFLVAGQDDHPDLQPVAEPRSAWSRRLRFRRGDRRAL